MCGFSHSKDALNHQICFLSKGDDSAEAALSCHLSAISTQDIIIIIMLNSSSSLPLAAHYQAAGAEAAGAQPPFHTRCPSSPAWELPFLLLLHEGDEPRHSPPLIE